MNNQKRIALVAAGTIFLISGWGKAKNNTDKKSNNENGIGFEETIQKTDIKYDDGDTSNVETPKETNYIGCDDYVYVSVNSNLRRDSNLSDNVMEVIDKCQKAHRIATNDDWDILEYDGKTGFVKSNCTEVLPETYIEVDISDQKIYLYKDKDLLMSSDIVSGKNTSPTRIGFFNIKNKSKNAVLRGPGYASHVKFWMPFDKGIGLHDAPWRKTFGGKKKKKNGSHGCVNLPNKTVSTIYNNYPVHSKVLVHK